MAAWLCRHALSPVGSSYRAGLAVVCLVVDQQTCWTFSVQPNRPVEAARVQLTAARQMHRRTLSNPTPTS